jgi:hypothetical protein
VVCEDPKRGVQMSPGEREHPVQALAAHRANELLGDRVRLGRPDHGPAWTRTRDLPIMSRRARWDGTATIPRDCRLFRRASAIAHTTRLDEIRRDCGTRTPAGAIFRCGGSAERTTTIPNGHRRRRNRTRRAGSGRSPIASRSSPIAATVAATLGARTSLSRSMRGLAAATSATAPSRAERAFTRYSSVRACRRSGVVSASTTHSYRLWSAVPLEPATRRCAAARSNPTKSANSSTDTAQTARHHNANRH